MGSIIACVWLEVNAICARLKRHRKLFLFPIGKRPTSQPKENTEDSKTTARQAVNVVNVVQRPQLEPRSGVPNGYVHNNGNCGPGDSYELLSERSNVEYMTRDRGLEMAKHKTFTVATNVKVYFCDSHSPWQRGTNENTNGLLRQYLPKRTDLSGYTQSQLDKIALRLNQRPRKTLCFETPASKLRASVAPTP
jgi:hypothetical protein